MFKNILFLVIAAFVGSTYGGVVVLFIIIGYTEMILSSVFNLYYASIFFTLGSYYSYKIFKKNQIQTSFEPEVTKPLPKN